MKNYFESFTTIVILVMIVFGCISLMEAETEIVAARETHAQVLRAVQDSDEEFLDDADALQQQLNTSVQSKHKNWTVKLEKLESSTARDYYLVSLNYTIEVPLFGVVSRGKIEGYAR